MSKEPKCPTCNEKMEVVTVADDYKEYYCEECGEYREEDNDLHQ